MQWIKSASYLHQKSVSCALNLVLFMLWCWWCSLDLSQIASLEGAVSAWTFLIIMLDLHQILCEFVTNITKYNANLSQKAPKCIFLLQIKCQKSAALKCTNISLEQSLEILKTSSHLYISGWNDLCIPKNL